jgi:hypothetical protein
MLADDLQDVVVEGRSQQEDPLERGRVGRAGANQRNDLVEDRPLVSLVALDDLRDLLLAGRRTSLARLARSGEFLAERLAPVLEFLPQRRDPLGERRVLRAVVGVTRESDVG